MIDDRSSGSSAVPETPAMRARHEATHGPYRHGSVRGQLAAAQALANLREAEVADRDRRLRQAAEMIETRDRRIRQLEAVLRDVLREAPRAMAILELTP